VWLDEIPPSDILQENIFRVMARQGWLWLTATPIGRPV
jgi:phage terminase large subunit-like protein